MIIIGHRGAKGLESENTIPAFKKALEFKADMVETDLRLQGKNIVLSHDETTKTETYTSLDELFKCINGKIPIVLEVKEPEVVPKLAAALKNYNGEIIFSSKSYSILGKIRQSFPNAKLAVTEKWSGVRAVAEASLLETRDIHINHNWLWSGFVRSMKHRGYNLFAYTVNTQERADELKAWGVDGIFTDYPNKIKGA